MIERSASLRRRPGTDESGYTLLEVMLALFIAGVASTLVVLAMPAPAPDLEREAKVFAARLTVAGQEAIVSGAPIGVSVDTAGYAFHRRVAGEWRSVSDDPGLARHSWSDGLGARVARDGVELAWASRDAGAVFTTTDPFKESAEHRAAPAAVPIARFDPTGGATALLVELSDAEHLYRVRVDVSGVVALESEVLF